MQVSVETTEGLERRMTIQVPAEGVDQEVSKRLQKYSKEMRMDGFRPGKVPQKVVKKRFGAQIRQEVAAELVEKSYYDAIKQEDLNPATMPAIDAGDFEEGKDLEFTAVFEVFPVVEIKDFSSIALERDTADITDADLADMIERLRQQRVEWKEVDRGAAEDDRLTVDYKGRVGDDYLADANREDAEVILGKGSLFPEFEKNLAGLKAGENAEFDVQFPDEYPAEDAAGKSVHFEVSVKAVAEAVLPEVDEAFAKEFGVEDGDLDEMRKQVKANMQRELDDRLRAANKDRVLDALLAAHDIPLPKALIDHEVERLNQPDQNTNAAPASPEQTRGQAERRVALGLLMRAVVEKHEIEIDQERVMQRLMTMAQSFEQPQYVIDMYSKNEQLRQELETGTLEEQVVDKVLEEANTNDNVMSFDDVMNPQPTPAS